MKHILFALFGVAFFTNYAVATSRTFNDFEAKSPNGLYTATAKSPENAEGYIHDPPWEKYLGFQKDFTITLMKQGEEKPVWVWKQKDKYASPIDLMLTDDGYAVMQDSGDGFRVFFPSGGSSSPIGIRQLIGEKALERYADDTTIGYLWQNYSKEGFYTHGDVTWFYLRTYWGFTLTLSLKNGLPTDDPAVLKGIEMQIIRETAERIKTLNDDLFSKCSGCGGRHLKSELVSDFFIIKKYKIAGGNAFIDKILEKSNDDSNADVKRHLDRL